MIMIGCDFHPSWPPAQSWRARPVCKKYTLAPGCCLYTVKAESDPLPDAGGRFLGRAAQSS